MILASLFAPRPPRWGLRGDPLLWDALCASLQDTDPTTVTDFEAHLYALYQEVVGSPLTDADAPVLVERFRAGGGMSAGMVSPRFWREEGIPLLVSRYRQQQPPQASFPAETPAAEETPPGLLWWCRETGDFYAIPAEAVLPEGSVRLWRLSGEARSVDAASLAPFALSREDAGRRLAQALTAPGAARQGLRSLLSMAQREPGAERVDAEAWVAGLEGILKGSGWMERLQGLRADLQASSQEPRPEAAANAQEELNATLGRLGEQMQRLGQRLQALGQKDPPT